MKKTYFLVSTLIVVSFLLGACAQTPTATVAPATTAPASVPATQVATSHEPVTITYWDVASQHPLDTVSKNMISEFMAKYPWITVQESQIPNAQYFTKVDTATAGGTAPDVLWVDHTVVPKYGFYKTIIPLDSLLPANYEDDFYPSTVQDSTYNGQIWAIPLHQSSEEIIYNQDIIDAAGLTPPNSFDNPWTFDQFRQALEKVTKKNADGSVQTWGFLTNYALSVYNWEPWIMAQGGTLMDPTLSTFTGYVNSDATIKAATWFANLFVDQLAPVETTPDMFPNGKVAFWQSNPIGINDIKNRFPNFKFGVMPMPCDKTCAVDSGQWEIGISSQSKQVEADWLFIDFLTNQAGQTEWVTQTGYLPARKSVYNSLPNLQQYPMKLFMDGLTKYPVHRPVSLAYQYFNAEMSTTISDLNKGADVKTGLDKVAADAQKQLDLMK